MQYLRFFQDALNQIRQEHRYRTFQVQTRGATFPWVQIQGRPGPVLAFCGVDYLGFSQHPLLKSAMKAAVDQYGVGAGGTRNIGGSHFLHHALEDALAAWHQQEAALLFSTGYVANEATLSTLGKLIPDLVFFSDEENHMSIIEGIRHAGNPKHIFKHNDLEDLEAKLKAYPLDHPKLIVFESVYSMSGDLGDLRGILDLAKRYQAMTYLDEVHAVGPYGQAGAGYSDTLGLASELTFIQGTLSKGLGGVGGYIAAAKPMIEAIRLNANGFIFTTAFSPAICAASLAAIDYLKTGAPEQKALFEVVDYLKFRLHAANIVATPSQSQIIPIWIGDSQKCQQIADRLLSEFNIYAQAINYPTVRKGQERLRISPTALHTLQMVDLFVDSLSLCLKD